MLPDEILKQIAEASHVVDIIGGYVPLTQTGALYHAPCPFDQERSHSFTVNPARQTFTCFECGRGGDGFQFVALYENVTFPEAARRLAARAGIQLPDEPETS